MSEYRPRSSLARNMLNKLNADNELEALDKSKWYKVDLDVVKKQEQTVFEKLKKEAKTIGDSLDKISDKFVQLDADEDTLDFISTSSEKSDWVLTQLWHNIAKSVLSWAYCQTDINGMLNRGSMFVFSKEHFLKMLKVENGWRSSRLLDLGAGDGKPTEVMAGLFDEVFVTEMSKPMRKILNTKGFQVLEIADWQKDEYYEVISCLNLLDRCDEPLTILSQVHQSLSPDGLLVVALVLPFRPYVESQRDHKPTQNLGIGGSGFESQLVSAVLAIEERGFSLLTWSRVPYLCEGDLTQPIYQLNDALMVFSKK